MNGSRGQKGVTLVELMFVVAVIAIIGVIAFPSYAEQVRKSKRSEGKAALVELANRIEKYAYDNGGNGYAGATIAALMGNATTESGHYQLQFATGQPTATTYILQAAPAGTFSDPGCQILTLDQAGLKDVTGTPAPTLNADQCW